MLIGKFLNGIPANVAFRRADFQPDLWHYQDPDPTDNSPDELSTSKGGTTDEQALANRIVTDIDYQVSSIYECDNKEQLTKYYHASFGSHPKTTLIAAAKKGFLRGCPGFTAAAISKFIGIEEVTCGKSNRGKAPPQPSQNEVDQR